MNCLVVIEIDSIVWLAVSIDEVSKDKASRLSAVLHATCLDGCIHYGQVP